MAADPEVLPEKTVYYPAADPVPAPSSGVSGLAAVLVVLVVAGTAVLIPVVCRAADAPESERGAEEKAADLEGGPGFACNICAFRV